jgi:iron complex outermembrane recepter protein
VFPSLPRREPVARATCHKSVALGWALPLSSIIVLLGAAHAALAQPDGSPSVPPTAPQASPSASPRTSRSSAHTPIASPTSSAVPEPSASLGPTPSEAVVPPWPIEQPPAVYPRSELGSGRAPRVVLLVTVDVEGNVVEPSVEESGGDAFDRAALDAVAAWRFEPARRNGVALASRIRVSVEFALPAAPAAAPTAASPPPAVAAKPQAEAPVEVNVHGERRRRSEERTASDFVLHDDVLDAAPRSSGAEVLRAVPGLYLSAAEGLAVAHGYSLRGFDAEHGQDIEFRVAGIPVNLPSHVHGQGYSDLGFLIAEAVHEVHATEGLSDPRQGDFAVAGSIDVELGVDEKHRGISLRSGYGSFDTFRELVLWAPKDAERETFAAVELTTTDGFGQNRAGTAGSALVQRRFGDDGLGMRLVGILHAARSGLAGKLRRDDVQSGVVCRSCVYPYPTAEAQSAAAGRALLGVFVDSSAESGENGEVGFWLGRDRFLLRENATGFQETSRTLAGVSGRGDLVEQGNSTDSLGFTARYRTAPLRPASWLVGSVEVGSEGRMDRVEQSENLIDATVRNEIWDRRIDAQIDAIDLGAFGDLDFSFGRRVRARLGARADLLSYDVNDRLGNLAPLSRAQDEAIPGYRRTAQGVALGPRASVEVRPSSWLALLSSYGEGYRSPQARTLEDGETAPFARVRSADAGVRFDFEEWLRLTLAGYATWLSDDIAFDASEGRMERIGPTARRGAVLHALSHPARGAVISLSGTLVDAELLEPPPPSAEEPDPPFESGQRLPFVPPLLVRADASFEETVVAGLPYGGLVGRIGFGSSFVSARPLPYGEFSSGSFLVDASTGLRLGALDLTFEVYNVLGSETPASEDVYASTWDPDSPRSRVPSRHVAAGAPRSWMLSLGVTL